RTCWSGSATEEILLPWTLERWREAHQGDQRQGAQDRGTPGGGFVCGREVGARCGGAAGEWSAAAEPAARLHLPLLAGLGDGAQGGRGGAVRAGGAGHLRLAPGVFLAGAGAGPAQPCAGLDRQVRRGPEGLAQHRPGVPMSRSTRGGRRRPGGRVLALAGMAGGMALAVAAAEPAALQAQAAEAAAVRAAVHPGDAKMYIGTYRNIVIIDEATSTVEGGIDLMSGMPRTMVLNARRDRFYVLNTMYETIEIVDIASRRSLDQFTLSEGSRKVRIQSFVVDPAERYLILLAKTYDRRSDRFEVSRPLLLKYDLQTRAVTDTIAWPEGEPRERAQLVFSPSGDLLYFFSDEILALETEGFTQVDSWNYEEALGDRLGSFDFGFPDQMYEEPGYYTGLFRMTDP